MRMLQQNFIQLLHCSFERGIAIDQQLSMQLLAEPVELSDPVAIQLRTIELERNIDKIKASFYGGATVEWYRVFYFAILAAILVFLLLDLNKLWTISHILLNGEKIVVLFLVYWFLFINIAFASPDWGTLYKSNYVPRFASLLTSIVLLWLYRYNSVVCESNGVRSTKSPADESRQYAIPILRNEALNWLILTRVPMFLSLEGFYTSELAFVISLAFILFNKYWFRAVSEKGNFLWKIQTALIILIEIYSRTSNQSR